MTLLRALGLVTSTRGSHLRLVANALIDGPATPGARKSPFPTKSLRRAQLQQASPHHRIAAVEQLIADVRQIVERRAFTCRSQRRMNLLLGSMRHRLRVDELHHYTVLREGARAAGGRIQDQQQGPLHRTPVSTYARESTAASVAASTS